MKAVAKSHGTTFNSSDLVQAFELGQAIGMGMAGQFGLDRMVAAIAGSVLSDEATYLRYDLDGGHRFCVALHGVQAEDIEDCLPTVSVAAALRAGHVQTFGPRGQRRSMIVLGCNARILDMLVLSQHCAPLLSATTDLLVAAWKSRRSGLIRAALGNADLEEQRPPILSPQNPFGLTRKEVQVCQFMSEGLKPRDMVERMDCSMPTIRTHLRNVYAKTGLDGMVGVLHQLHVERRTAEGPAT